MSRGIQSFLVTQKQATAWSDESIPSRTSGQTTTPRRTTAMTSEMPQKGGKWPTVATAGSSTPAQESIRSSLVTPEPAQNRRTLRGGGGCSSAPGEHALESSLSNPKNGDRIGQNVGTVFTPTTNTAHMLLQLRRDCLGQRYHQPQKQKKQQTQTKTQQQTLSQKQEHHAHQRELEAVSVRDRALYIARRPRTMYPNKRDYLDEFHFHKNPTQRR